MSEVVASTTEIREFRPSWTTFHRRLLGRLLLLGPLLLLVVLVAAPSIGLALVMLGAVSVLGGLGLAVYFGRMRVSVLPDRVRVHGALRTRSWTRDEPAAAVFLPQPGPALVPPGAERATLYLVSREDSRLFRLGSGTWERTVLDELATAIGAPVIIVPPGLTAEEIRDRYPGTIGWTAVHPWLVAFVLAASVPVLMFVTIILIRVVLVATGQLQLPLPH